MTDPTPTPSPEPWEKTQSHDPEALRLAHASGGEGATDQETPILPAGLPMLESLPSAGEEPTQPIPLHIPQHIEIPEGSLPLDAEEELLAILGGPDATVRLQAGSPTSPQGPNATVAMPVGQLTQPDATQILPVASPLAADPLETKIQHRNVSTTIISPSELPTPKRKGMPFWGWVILAVLVLLLGVGSVYLLRPDLLNLGISEEKIDEAPVSETNSNQPATSEEPKIAETPAAEVPPALRSYVEKAQKGDAASMRMLGVMYYQGLNVPKNEREGLKWYRKAADAGNKTAQKELLLLEGKAEK